MRRTIPTLSLLALGLTLALAAAATVTAGGAATPAGSVAWHRDGAVVVTTLDGTEIRRARARWQASLSLSPDGTMLAVVDRDVRLVDLASGRSRTIVPGGSVPGRLTEAVFSPSGRYVAVAHGDERCRRLPGVVVVDLSSSERERPRLWPVSKPWRVGESTRIVDVVGIGDDGLLSFRESGYEFGECRYQALERETVWVLPRGSSGPLRIVTDPEIGALAWSRDRSRLAYTIGGGDACELWIADGRGRHAKRIARRDYVRHGCSRGISGIPVIWHPSASTVYYADGSRLWSWERASRQHRAIVRPPGAPTSRCQLDQSCLDHDLLDVSSDGTWLLLAQEKPQSIGDTLLLVSTVNGSVQTVRPPGPGFLPAAARLG